MVIKEQSALSSDNEELEMSFEEITKDPVFDDKMEFIHWLNKLIRKARTAPKDVDNIVDSITSMYVDKVERTQKLLGHLERLSKKMDEVEEGYKDELRSLRETIKIQQTRQSEDKSERKGLTAERIEEAFQLYVDNDWSAAQFATFLGINRMYGAQILGGKVWKSVPRPDGLIYPKQERTYVTAEDAEVYVEWLESKIGESITVGQFAETFDLSYHSAYRILVKGHKMVTVPEGVKVTSDKPGRKRKTVAESPDEEVELLFSFSSEEPQVEEAEAVEVVDEAASMQSSEDDEDFQF